MAITYTTGIPDPTHNPSVDAPNMQTNTSSIDSWNAVDHYSFSSTSAGHHKKSVYVVQGSDPGSAASQAVQYSKTGSIGSSELYLQRDAVSTAIQLTAGTTKINGDWNTGSSGQTFLPGGLQLKWGTVSVTTSQTVTFASLTGLTNFQTAALTGWATAKSANTTFNIQNITTTQITLACSGTATCLWFALGY